MSDELAVQLQGVTKRYALYKKQRPSLARVFGFGKAAAASIDDPEHSFTALTGVDLKVARGERVGIVGRNGAGKTTLLKLLCGNFEPSEGTVEVNGGVQALMAMGTGFHPEHTGRRNVEISLKYNDLTDDEQQAAIADIEDFCELGGFFDQPFKTYSLGMQARLMFAVATAVRPEILVVDEVLGAGDAYFVAKSKLRVEQLVKSGCTMILVSHSMSQILELCTRAIWLDQGQVRMDDEAFLVVKAYEEFMHGPIEQMSGGSDTTTDDSASNTPVNTQGTSRAVTRTLSLPEQVQLQEPRFLPHADVPELPGIEDVDPTELMFQAPGGISRWDSNTGVKLSGFSVVTESGISNEITTYRPAAFVLGIRAERKGDYALRYGIALHDYQGNCLTRIFSPKDEFAVQKGDLRQVSVLLNPNQLGAGEYVVGVSILEYAPIELLNSTERYDLLSRSFVVSIVLPDSLAAMESAVLHSAEWQFTGLN